MEKLFDLRSQLYEDSAPICSGETMQIARPAPKRCIPQQVRMAAATRDDFTLLDVVLGVAQRRLLRSEEGFTLIGREGPSQLVLEIGMDARVAVRNDSPEPAHFRCEVWGQFP